MSKFKHLVGEWRVVWVPDPGRWGTLPPDGVPLRPAGNGAPAFVVSYALPRRATPASSPAARRYDLKKMLERGMTGAVTAGWAAGRRASPSARFAVPGNGSHTAVVADGEGDEDDQQGAEPGRGEPQPVVDGAALGR